MKPAVPEVRAATCAVAFALLAASPCVRASAAQEAVEEARAKPGGVAEPTTAAEPATPAQPTGDEIPPTEGMPAKKKGSYTRWKLPAAGDSRSGDPEIILTFDDGPHERRTKLVLDELAKRNLKAIFFWTGRRVSKKSPLFEKRRALVERAVREGHIVAAHGVDHLHLCVVPKRTAEAELDRGLERYRELTGLPMVFFRTPYGDHCKRLLRMLEERGLVHLHWDIDPMEWTDHDSGRVAATLQRKLRRLQGRAVMLMHDTQAATARALPQTLDWIDAENQRRRERGRRPIRILSGSDLARERLDPALAGWAIGAATAARDRLVDALVNLVL